MNKETTLLLESLANKLGTTSEYLWGILIKQAPISSTIDLIIYSLWLLAGFGFYKVFKYLKSKDLLDDGYGASGYAVCLLICSTFWGIGVIAIVFSLNSAITGFINPEYWALKEILDSVKK